jgi:hypothetical protein
MQAKKELGRFLRRVVERTPLIEGPEEYLLLLE